MNSAQSVGRNADNSLTNGHLYSKQNKLDNQTFYSNDTNSRTE